MRFTDSLSLLLFKTTFRHWRDAWASYLILISIVAVGVGAFNGIRQASRAASANFGLFNEAVSGRSDFIIEAEIGILESAELEALAPMALDSDWHLLPVIEGSVAQTDPAGQVIRQLRVVGLDLIGLGNLPNFIDQGLSFADEQGGQGEWSEWIGDDSGVWISEAFSLDTGIGKGDGLQYAFGGKLGVISVAGVLRSEGSSLPEDVVICDIIVAQKWLNRVGQLDRVELFLWNRMQKRKGVVLGKRGRSRGSP